MDVNRKTYRPLWPSKSDAARLRYTKPSVLRIASDETGTDWWMTAEEAERAAKEAERAAKEVALRRVVELEALLAKQSGR